jgi:hypothetical protein
MQLRGTQHGSPAAFSHGKAVKCANMPWSGQTPVRTYSARKMIDCISHWKTCSSGTVKDPAPRESETKGYAVSETKMMK